MSTAPSIIPSDQVIRWRQEVGGLLNGLWHKSKEVREGGNNQLLIIFGGSVDDRPLRTPLAMTMHCNPEDSTDELMIIATEMWHQPIGCKVIGVYDLEDPYTGLRVVIATSKPISTQLSDQLYHLLLDRIERNLPDEIFHDRP